MAHWFGLWYGGESYTPPQPDDLEEFTSLADAGRTLIERYRHGYWQRSHFAFVHREPVDVLTPVVGDDCEITLYRSRAGIDYPVRRIFLGPRGGVRCEPC